MLADLVLARAAANHSDLEACVVLLDAESPRPDALPLSGSWEGPIAVGGQSMQVATLALDTAVMLAEQGSADEAGKLVQTPPPGFVWGLYLGPRRVRMVVALYPRSHASTHPSAGPKPSDA